MSRTDIKTEVSSELDLGTLLKLIPDFDTTQSSQVYRFIRSCDSAFKIANTAQQQILMTYALNKITGPGSSDVHAKQFFLWTDLKIFLIQKFSKTKTLAHLFMELQSMFQKPNESITDYYIRVDLCRSKILEKLATEINDQTLEGRKITTEETALNVFINGISSDIGTMLRVNSFTQLSEAGNIAIQEEKIRNMNSARQKLYRQNVPLPPQIQPRRQIAYNPPYNKINQNQTPNHSQNTKICNYCKNPGHLISECRKRAYNNNFKNNQYPMKSSPPTKSNVNHLNSQAAGDMSTSPETALAHCSNAQTHMSDSLNTDLDDMQLQF